MIDLIVTLMLRLAKEVPGVLSAVDAKDADAETRLRMWLENAAELQSEAQRTSDIVQAAKDRLG